MGRLSSCWESCSKTRVKAKSNDHTEKAQFVGHVLMALFQIVAIQGGFQLFILGLHAASDGPPRDVEYGWAVFGNNSLSDPNVLARTDMDNSSSTYGLWTPPDEWRDKCLRSYGFPMTACSYFQTREYPTFMSAFWVIYFIGLVISTINRMMFFLFYVGETYLCLKVNYKTLPQHAKHLDAKGMNHLCVIRTITMAFAAFLLIPYFKTFYCYVGQGAGLVHSMHTGNPYIGADWNTHPVPHVDELVDLQWYANFLPQQRAARGFVYMGTPNGHWHSTFSGTLPPH